MAERRMFTKKITESDAFLDMPASTQALYFHLNMAADDDGFVNNPKKIQRMCGFATDDDMKLLIAKSFIIIFETGIIVIKHWKMHNYIQKDRYRPTDYTDEKNMLEMKKNKVYTLKKDACIQDGYNMDTECIQDGYVGKDRLGKDRLGKDNNICPEPLQASEQEATQTPPAITLTLNTKEEYPIYQKDIDEWEGLYPAVDIMQELRKMKGWCDSNPSRRKTSRGIRRFINSWLAKEQDKGGNVSQKHDVKSQNGHWENGVYIKSQKDQVEEDLNYLFEDSAKRCKGGN